MPPSNPNIRTQPYSYTKMSQTPNGFISYNDFMRPSLISVDENKKNHFRNSSIKVSSTTIDSGEASMGSMKDLFS